MTAEVTLRAVEAGDLTVFFEHQLDPDATRMAAFPPRDRDAFLGHWARIMVDEAIVLRTIVFRDAVAGNIVAWEHGGRRQVGFWLGKDFWGRGIASAALSEFLRIVDARPLHAHVAGHNGASIRVLEKCGFTRCGENDSTVPEGDGRDEVTLLLRGNRRSEANS